jgi:hypothetical protein
MPIQPNRIISFGSPVCHTNGDFARSLRHIADLIEHEEYPPLRHLMMVTLNHEGKVERSSYGDPGFTTLNAVALLEWAKMQVYDETP